MVRRFLYSTYFKLLRIFCNINPMLKYKYVNNYYEYDPDEEEFCNKHNIIYFKPDKQRELWLENWMKTTTLPEIETDPDIVCYWRSFGTWGMYHPDDKSISVCPYRIEEVPGGLEGVIRHELEHLKHPEADKMEHEKKEDYINNLPC